MTGQNFLLYRISEGDSVAFREIFERYSPRVYSFALKLTHSSAAAEEMVQEVFLKIWLNRKALRGIDHFPAYLFAMTRNLALNFLKHLVIEEKAKTSMVKESPVAVSEEDEENAYNERHALLRRVIERLPPQQRLVYSLCYDEGLKYEEVAQKLRISRLTVKTHMQQALRNIRSHFPTIVRILIPCLLNIFSHLP